MLPFFRTRPKPGIMALLVQGDCLSLAHVVHVTGSRPEVCALETFAIEGDLVSALQRLRHSRKLGSFACTTLMSEGEYSLTQLEAPAVPRGERKEALRWAIKEMVGYPVESACIDVLDIPGDGLPHGRSAGVLVVSASEQSVSSRVRPFEAAKIDLQAVDIPELAQRNIAALLEDENRGLAFLRLDSESMMLTLTFRGELVAVRRSEMNTSQLNGDDHEQQARIRERLVLEFQRSLDNFDRQYSHIPISKVIFAAWPAVADLADDLRESTYLPVKEMDLADVLDYRTIPELKDGQNQAKNLLLIGAALRGRETLP